MKFKKIKFFEILFDGIYFIGKRKVGVVKIWKRFWISEKC